VTVKLEPFDAKGETVVNCLFCRSTINTCENEKLFIDPASVSSVACALVNVTLSKTVRVLSVPSTVGLSTIHSADNLEAW
jgi:hypothetical protein